MTLSVLRFISYACLLVLLTVSSPYAVDAGITGEKWVLVGFTKYRDALFIDMNRLACETNQQPQVWSRIKPAQRSKYFKQIQRDLKKVGKSPREFRYVETLNEIDCRNRQIRYLKVIYFQEDGRVIHATRDDSPRWKSINAGSLWDGLQAAACNQKRGSTAS